jgi:DNA (cytosine-5)-methyltransferase 1
MNKVIEQIKRKSTTQLNTSGIFNFGDDLNENIASFINNPKEPKKSFKFIDLFAGIGGFRMALDSVGGNCVYTSEWDKYAQTTYKANFGGQIDGDITKVDEKDIPEHDILCGGFPCQAFSISGKQKGFADTRGTLFFDIVRIVELHKPKILFLENVRNFAKHDNGKTLKIVVETLEGLGYNITFEVLNASFYGAPTSRERIYIVGIRKDLNKSSFVFPTPTHQPITLNDILEKQVDSKYFVKRTDIEIEEENDESNAIIPFPKLKPIRIGTIGKGGQGERIYSSRGHAITLSAYGGGAASKTGAYLIDGNIRKLTPRECARVMGFPDSYKIPVTDSQAYKQFGNSVAVPVITAIAENLTKYL